MTRSQFPLIATVVRIPMTQTQPLASGLKDGWKDKAKSNRGLVRNETMLGGLDDQHALSVRPKFTQRKLEPVEPVSPHHGTQSLTGDIIYIDCWSYL